jgi:hypothetical protein
LFQNPILQDHLENSYSIETDHATVAEWNMNVPGNINKLGNYRFRRNDTRYSLLPNFFSTNDDGNFYTGATDSDVAVDFGLKEDATTPLVFTYRKDKESLYYSLEDCVSPFRPRSGINKLSYFSNKFLPHSNADMYLRPRYYMPTRDDQFKYWRSYRVESDTNILYPSVISPNANIKSIVRLSNTTWNAVVENLSSVSDLPVGKGFSASPSFAITASATATVSDISGTGPWTARLEGLTSTQGLRVGDRLAAEAGTGALNQGVATEITITGIVSNSVITYRVAGGSIPLAGTVTNVRTIPGTLGLGKTTVLEVLSPTSVFVLISGTTAPSYGTIRNVLVNKYRTNIEYGISKNGANGVYPIDDANPFVAYKTEVPANRIVVKIQTHVGNINLGPFKNSSTVIDDPFFGEDNKVAPSNFKVQYLTPDNIWVNAFEFNSNSVREDGSPIFGADGHLSLEYGLEVPVDYVNNFRLFDTVSNAAVLPKINRPGAAYMVVPQENSLGKLFIYNGAEYEEFEPKYSWFVSEEGVAANSHFVTDFTNPSYFIRPGESSETYREFVWVKGIRLAVDTMTLPDVPLELIEMSPRLVANISNFVESFNVTKPLANLSSSALPVGELLASTGTLQIFDTDQTFNSNNKWNKQTKKGSILAEYLDKSVKILFYEVINNVNQSNYYVPIKTLYSDGFLEAKADTGKVSISLRDFYFYFESLKSPRMLITEASLSQAICILLDSVGFSNYVFKRDPEIADPVIPFFFIPPDQSLSETLNQLAKATQSAMFFDEFNNFIVMTKEYLLDPDLRPSEITLYGENDNGKLANIISVASKEKKVYNSGTINYTTRYIQRTGGSLGQNKFLDKQYVYNPSMLWEAAGTERTTSQNSELQERFALSAMPLNTTISANVPTVSGGRIINNVIDVGENAYYITRFSGLLYSSGEIIKYDAVEYNVSGIGNVWISSNLEYQSYFPKLPFNGKIYPTGLIRIYAEPFYQTNNGIESLKEGAVVSHGRGQFGTPVVSHSAGLSEYWTDNANVRGCDMDSSLLYSTTLAGERTLPETTIGAAGVNKTIAEKLQRTSIIRNFLSTKHSSETVKESLKTTTSGTIQSSALVLTGPDFSPTATPRNFVSYVHKKLDGAYKHFGTRVRIIGKIEAAGNRSQTVVGGMTYFNVNADPTETVSLGGGSAGVSWVNPETNNGYYFEIAALTSANIEKFLEKNENNEATVSVENVLFYKVKKDKSGKELAVPIRLYGGVANILVDDGNFAGQYRYTGEENPTVYDLAMEYVDIDSKTREFYLYINQKLIARVTDTDPLSIPDSSVSLFVRGTSKAMFENIYALSKNYATNTVFDTNTPIAPIFGDGDNQINASEALNKYALSGAVQQTYLSNINPTTVPAYNLYFEEFGSILREAAYFNIKYDRAYPALYAKIAPTVSRIRGYTVSGFTADSYGAEFLVFNNTDTILSLDEKSSNYLRIIGVTFTQNTTQSLTADDFLKRKSDLSKPELKGDGLARSPFKFVKDYEELRLSRILYGKNDFSLDSIYIQDQDTAENMLAWLIDKNIKPRKLVGLSIFPNPMIQLGDVVNIKYTREGIDQIDGDDVKYIVYNIEYNKGLDGPSMNLYLSEA